MTTQEPIVAIDDSFAAGRLVKAISTRAGREAGRVRTAAEAAA